MPTYQVTYQRKSEVTKYHDPAHIPCHSVTIEAESEQEARDRVNNMRGRVALAATEVTSVQSAPELGEPFVPFAAAPPEPVPYVPPTIEEPINKPDEQTVAPEPLVGAPWLVGESEIPLLLAAPPTPPPPPPPPPVENSNPLFPVLAITAAMIAAFTFVEIWTQSLWFSVLTVVAIGAFLGLYFFPEFVKSVIGIEVRLSLTHKVKPKLRQ